MKKVLLVDDDAAVREMCESILNRCLEGALVEHASNGMEALEKISSSDYSAIVCDVDMPVMGGILFYKKLKLAFPSLAQRVVFVSGNFDDQTLSFLHNEGRPYLPKPFVKKEFLHILNPVLESRQQ